MAKFAEAASRLFYRVFVCKNCKKKKRGNVLKFVQGKTSCQRCGCKAFRAIKKNK